MKQYIKINNYAFNPLHEYILKEHSKVEFSTKNVPLTLFGIFIAYYRLNLHLTSIVKTLSSKLAETSCPILSASFFTIVKPSPVF